MSLNHVDQLNKGQLAYRDLDGDMIILDMQDQGIREAFITRLTQEHLEDRDAEQLIEKFKQAYQQARDGETKKIGELKGEASE